MTDTPRDLRAEWLGADGVRLHWRVDNLATIMETWESVQVYTAGAHGGPYTELGAPVPLAEGLSLYSANHAAGTEATWYRVALYEAAGPTTGPFTDPVAGSGGGRYITVEDLRAAGFTQTQASNDQLRRTITDTEAFVEEQTGRWFYPRPMQLRVDGTDSHILPLHVTIVEVNQIRVLSAWAEFGTLYGDVTLDNVRVANRHLTLGLPRLDDRDAPCLTFEAFEHHPPGSGTRVSRWWEGTQNIVIDGWFGHTELSPNDPVGETEEGSQIPLCRGRTPVLVKRIMLLMVARWLPSPADTEDYYEQLREWSVEKYKMRDQEIIYSKQAMVRGPITGDPEIDTLVSYYTEPIDVAFV